MINGKQSTAERLKSFKGLKMLILVTIFGREALLNVKIKMCGLLFTVLQISCVSCNTVCCCVLLTDYIK